MFLVLVDRLTVADLMLPEAAPLRDLIVYGGVGLANVRTEGTGSAAGYLTLGAGARALAGEHAGLAFGVNELWRGQGAGVLYSALTGEAAGDGLVHLAVGEQALLAGENKRHATPGLLGSLVRTAGVSVAVYGNADVDGTPRRYGVLVAMDTAGRVDHGDVGERTLVHDAEWPFGLRTDYAYLLDRAAGHFGTSTLVVLDLGDLARLEAFSQLLSPERGAELRRQTVARIASFVATLFRQAGDAGSRGALLVAVPSPSAIEAQRGHLVAPLIMLELGDEPAAVDGALLSSPTTRRAGIVANVDVTATVLSLFDLDQSSAGRPLELVPFAAPWERVLELYERITRVHGQRLPLIQPYFFIQLAAVLVSVALAAGASLLRWPVARVLPWLRAVHLALVAFPLALLLIPLFPVPRTVGDAWLLAAAATAALTAGALCLRRRSEADPFAGLAGLTVGVIVVDLLTGARLLQSSHLGYDPIGGSRYYGIGNEYMGLLIGAGGVAAGGLLEIAPAGKRARLLWLVGFAFVAIAVLLASPAHGANVGGTVSAVVGLGVVLLLLVQDKIHLHHFVLLGALVAAVVGAAALYDLVRFGPESSHLGGAVRLVGTEGGDPLWSLFERKLEMNVRLIRLTVWSRAFFVSLVAAVLFAFVRPRTVRGLLHAYPYMSRALRGSLAGALVALAANDSGIVAAATLMIPVVSTLLYLALTLADGARRRAEP